MVDTSAFEDFLSRGCDVAVVSLTRVFGSSPRDAGARMYVASDAIFGTIGGGQLEHMAIAEAREMLTQGDDRTVMDIPLGPDIGQCCGGRVELEIRRVDEGVRSEERQRFTRELMLHKNVYILGAGHVGRALADLMQHLPVNVLLIDPRAGELAKCRAKVEQRLSAMPEMDITAAPPGSAFIVTTHEHAQDFLLTCAALERGDAVYVGMIGSSTKRAKFRNWCRDHCEVKNIDVLVCPIGAGRVRDKRPEIIAAMVLAEVIEAFGDQSEPIALARAEGK